MGMNPSKFAVNSKVYSIANGPGKIKVVCLLIQTDNMTNRSIWSRTTADERSEHCLAEMKYLQEWSLVEELLNLWYETNAEST
ncbi:hypothetical protein NPIL_123321 [Nephila pilipes]|uniref:Uncharacterized protein n=1 Tax=Nephila pilipes TaxID=299642 RepID=A0A8X6M5D4_NEPPI|nr:hypothetical protein NPIL_123321 [Nephila pilipes]